MFSLTSQNGQGCQWSNGCGDGNVRPPDECVPGVFLQHRFTLSLLTAHACLPARILPSFPLFLFQVPVQGWNPKAQELSFKSFSIAGSLSHADMGPGPPTGRMTLQGKS